MQSPRQSVEEDVWVIRVNSMQGRYRLQLYPSDTYQKVLEMISQKLGCEVKNLQVCNNYGKKLNIPLEKRLKDVVYLSHGSLLFVRQLGDVKNSALQERPAFLSADSRASSKTTISPPKTQCSHPSNVRCLKCLSSSKQTDNYQGNGLLTTNNKDKKQIVTAACDHGPRMKCLKCIGQPEVVAEKQKKIVTVRSMQKINPQEQSPACKHSPRIKCNKCMNSPKQTSKIVKINNNKSPRTSKQPSLLNPNPKQIPKQMPKEIPKELSKEQSKKQIKKQKCQHGPSGKCLNCYVSDNQKDSLKKKEQCTHGPNTKCLNCINIDEKAAHVAFDQYLLLRSKGCHHPTQNTCSNCIPPKNLRLKMDKNCNAHLPYPQGLCNSCMPQNVSIKRQQYRHVDYVQFMNHNQIQNFIDYWLKEKRKSQLRIGFLYGYYAQDPYYKNGIRAVVEALYQPHQKCTDTLFWNTDTNKRKRDVQLITQSLGLQKIGMIIASNNKDASFTETQIRFMARLQEQLSVTHSSGYRLSNFFTVSIRQNVKDGKSIIEPQIFMVSDQGQAMEAAGLFLPNKNNQYKMKLKQQALPNELIPNVFVTGKIVKEFQLQFLLVKIAAGTDKSNKFAVLKSNEFPPSSRGPVKVQQIKEYIRKSKVKPCSVRFGDLNLLVFVAEVLDINMAMGIGLRVGEEAIIEESLCQLVDRQMQKLIS